MKTSFDYNLAFARNRGLFSDEEQGKISRARVALAGLGGMGGGNAIVLARMGFQNFNIADLDHFDWANINRQMGASASTIGQPKVDVIYNIIKDINPDSQITKFERGINQDNIDSFLDGVDAVVDAIDFYSISVREMLFQKAYEKKIPVFSAGPMGYSTAFICFDHTGMSFHEYFNIRSGMSYFDKLVHFAIGLSPRATHWSYMNVPPEDVMKKRGPSLASACFIGNGVLATEVSLAITKQRKISVAPHFMQYDPFKQKLVKGCLWWGNKNPLQKLKIFIMKKKYEKFKDLIEKSQIKD